LPQETDVKTGAGMSFVCQPSPTRRGYTPHPRRIWHRRARERASTLAPRALSSAYRRKADNPFVFARPYQQRRLVPAHGKLLSRRLASVLQPGSSILRHGQIVSRGNCRPGQSVHMTGSVLRHALIQGSKITS